MTWHSCGNRTHTAGGCLRAKDRVRSLRQAGILAIVQTCSLVCALWLSHCKRGHRAVKKLVERVLSLRERMAEGQVRAKIRHMSCPPSPERGKNAALCPLPEGEDLDRKFTHNPYDRRLQRRLFKQPDS